MIMIIIGSMQTKGSKMCELLIVHHHLKHSLHHSLHQSHHDHDRNWWPASKRALLSESLPADAFSLLAFRFSHLLKWLWWRWFSWWTMNMNMSIQPLAEVIMIRMSLIILVTIFTIIMLKLLLWWLMISTPLISGHYKSPCSLIRSTWQSKFSRHILPRPPSTLDKTVSNMCQNSKTAGLPKPSRHHHSQIDKSSKKQWRCRRSYVELFIVAT